MQPLRFCLSHRGCPGAKTTNVCPSRRMLSRHLLPALSRWPCAVLCVSLQLGLDHRAPRPSVCATGLHLVDAKGLRPESMPTPTALDGSRPRP